MHLWREKNLKARGLQGDTQCARSGAEEESNIHIFFECPPAVQTWAISKIPSNPKSFHAQSVYANMDYMFWRVQPWDNHQYPWIYGISGNGETTKSSIT